MSVFSESELSTNLKLNCILLYWCTFVADHVTMNTLTKLHGDMECLHMCRTTFNGNIIAWGSKVNYCCLTAWGYPAYHGLGWKDVFCNTLFVLFEQLAIRRGTNQYQLWHPNKLPQVRALNDVIFNILFVVFEQLAIIRGADQFQLWYP